MHTASPAPAASPASPAPAAPVTCSLCGHRFIPGPETLSCPSCVMRGHCEVICCPHCGYEFVGRSRLVDWVRRLWGGLRRASVRS